MNDLRLAELQAVRDDLARTKDVLGTLIAWMVQSANSPIRFDEAEQLLRRLAGGDWLAQKKSSARE
jgi:hypothetical protein